ncbi:hypothetical protein VIBR0546_20570 [Vibrio brasiliensis LMG 20546]|uniref:Uncharacterized protein n=1 Tax=Vibrio brasiliensis LMG 20546 TaxID=945543 RepID=E8LZP4_9VIBR|nr:hypothetical protein VIBR0546_20570 [Vibrio brasiliensis LMG 20546]
MERKDIVRIHSLTRMLVIRKAMDTSRMRQGQYQDDTKDTAQGTSDVG